MSRSKNAVELCALLVDETYGELTSRIFTILLRRGRLTHKSLRVHTRLGERAVKHGLAVLIQQGLVYHNLDADGATFYEANHDAAYGLARSGKIMEVVESRFGTFARDTMQNLFLLGHSRISDLEKEYESGPTHSNGNGHLNGHGGTNGLNGHRIERPSIGAIHTVLAQLLRAGMLEAVNSSMLQSPTDLYNKIEKEVLTTFFGGSTKGIKQKEESKAKIQARVESAKTDGRQWQLKGKKRMANGDHEINGSHKRRRLSNGDEVVNGGPLYEDDGTRLAPNLVLRVNYEKCTVALRNQALATFARDRIGETTSLIYAEALRLLEDKIPRCREDSNVDRDDLPDGPSFTTMQLTAALNRSINTGAGIGKSSNDKSKNAKEDGRDANMEEPESEEDVAVNGNGKTSANEDDDPFAGSPAKPKGLRVTFQDKLPGPPAMERSENRMQQVKNHLQLLESDDCRFVRKCGTSGQGEWTVDFDRVIKSIQETEVDAMLLENFGKFGHRLARMLRKFGKLDEKQLPTLALMKQKDVRTKLAEMQMAGVVDIQEVPRDGNRNNPARIIFLWFFDSERVATVMLENTYKMMSRCLQRLDVERQKAADVIALTQRTDVQHQEPEEYLDGSQLNAYQIFRAREDALLGQVLRLDQLIGIFRDF